MSRAITVLVAGGVERAEGIDLLEGVLWGFLKNPKGTRFEVPTADPSGLLGALGDRFPLWPLGVRVWQGARGPFGVPTVRSMRRTDLVLLTGALDGVVRPALLLAALAARALARPLVGYGLGIDAGASGRAARRWLLGCCREVVARDGASEVEARRAGALVRGRAEPAFHLRAADAKSVAGIFPQPAGERLGIELGALTRRGLGRGDVAQAVAAATGITPVFFAEGEPPGDGGPGETPTLERARHRAETWTGLLGALDLFVGERPSWILRCLAMGVPVVVPGDGRGVAGVLDDLGLDDLRVKAGPATDIAGSAATAWRTRDGTAKRVRAASALARDVAREAAGAVSRRYLGGR